MSVTKEKTVGMTKIMARLDCPQFEYLARRFATAPAGEDRDYAKQALLSFVARTVGEIGKAEGKSK